MAFVILIALMVFGAMFLFLGLAGTITFAGSSENLVVISKQILAGTFVALGGIMLAVGIIMVRIEILNTELRGIKKHLGID